MIAATHMTTFVIERVNMENVNSSMRKWGNIALIISFFGILFGIISIFRGIPVNNSIGLILVGFSALFASIVLREESTERRTPILRFASGVCIVAAVFSQAVSVKNQYFALLLYFGAVLLIALFVINIYNNKKI